MRLRSVAGVAVLAAALLAGCTDDPGVEGPPNTEEGDAEEYDAPPVPARFDDGAEDRRTFWMNGTIPAGRASGCNVEVFGDQVCVGDEDRFDLAPLVTQGYLYRVNATLSYEPDDMVGATNIGYRSSEPWTREETGSEAGRETLELDFVRLTQEPLYVSVYHLLPAEHEITYSLQVDVHLLHQTGPALPLAVAVDRSATGLRVAVGDEGAVRVWDGADTYLGRFTAENVSTEDAGGMSGGANGTPETGQVVIDLAGADRSGELVLYRAGSGGTPLLIHALQDPGAPAPALRFLATETVYEPYAAMQGPVDEEWSFNVVEVPLRLGVYMGEPDPMTFWTANRVRLALQDPQGDVIAGMETSCVVCGGALTAWSDPADPGLVAGTYTARAEAMDTPETNAGGDVGHLYAHYVR